MFLCERKYCSHTLYSFLIIVKFLQFRRRMQIAEPRKYYLVYVIVFFGMCFLYFFFFLTGWEFGLIPYTYFMVIPLYWLMCLVFTQASGDMVDFHISLCFECFILKALSTYPSSLYRRNKTLSISSIA